MIVVADTSGLFSAFDQAQADHSACRDVLLHDNLLISPLVLTELDHLVGRDLGFRSAFAITATLIRGLNSGSTASLSSPEPIS